MHNTFNGKLAQLDLLDKYGRFVSKHHGQIEFPEGWLSLEKQIFEKFEQANDGSIRLQHVKAEDGRLEVYYEGGDRRLFEDIKKITYQSHFMCEVCGEDIKLDFDHPEKHTCDKHTAKVEWLFEPKQVKLLKRRYAIARKGFRLEDEE